MEAAEKLFGEKGFEGSSVRDIAQEANINIAMISYYFGSKEKLLEALFTYRGENTIRKLESMLTNPEQQPLEKVNQLIDYFIDKFYDQQYFHKIMMREQVANQHTAITKLITHFKKNNQQLVKELICDGQKKGVFRKNIDIPIMMATLTGTLSNMVTTQHYYREINNLQSMPEIQFKKLVKKKLSVHLKIICKAILTHEK